ncbi:MAG: hypothetical protein GW788_02975 [Ignavibacteria bacterium]|nr:hypothetical protein [Ignavibacteria bacterium]
MSFNHISNGGFADHNPSVENVSFFFILEKYYCQIFYTFFVMLESEYNYLTNIMIFHIFQTF